MDKLISFVDAYIDMNILIPNDNQKFLISLLRFMLSHLIMRAILRVIERVQSIYNFLFSFYKIARILISNNNYNI